jgi:hypothetical protein
MEHSRYFILSLKDGRKKSPELFRCYRFMGKDPGIVNGKSSAASFSFASVAAENTMAS